MTSVHHAFKILYAGQYAYLSLLLVGGTLYLFRKIYGEIVGVLPLNGGAYNVLLKSNNKSIVITTSGESQ